MSEHESEQDESETVGLEGLADKMKAVSALVERRRQQVTRREALLREAVASLLRPVSAEEPQSSDPGPVPPPDSRLPGLTAQPAWQRAVGERWLVATDLVNNTTSEVPSPRLLLSASPDEPLTYETRLATLPFQLGARRLDERPVGGLPPGQTVRTIAVVSVPPAAASDGCRLSLSLAAPATQQQQLDNDVGFYQLPAGDVTLTADDLLSRRNALFSETGGVSEVDEQALWALSGRPLRLRLRTPRPLSLQAGRGRLLQAGFVSTERGSLIRTDADHPLFGCLVLLEDCSDSERRTGPGNDTEGLAVTIWSREERQLPLLLHQLRQLFGPDCELRSGRRPHTADQLRDGLLAQLQFVEQRIGGGRVGGGGAGPALRLGDVHVPLAEYAPWRQRLTELEEATAACALDLVEPEHAAMAEFGQRDS